MREPHSGLTTPRMRTRRPLGRPLFFLLAAILPALLLTGCDKETTGTIPVKVGGEWFTLETAYTLDDRAQGLMFRTEIPEDGGMFFIFNDSRERSFWMKNCLVDMDIIYLDRALRIVSAYNMKAQPPRRDDESESEYEDRIRESADYPSRGPAQFVIELKAGKIQDLGIKRGEKIHVDEDRLKELIRLADDSPWRTGENAPDGLASTRAGDAQPTPRLSNALPIDPSFAGCTQRACGQPGRARGLSPLRVSESMTD